jgi:hypothetical protein
LFKAFGNGAGIWSAQFHHGVDRAHDEWWMGSNRRAKERAAARAAEQAKRAGAKRKAASDAQQIIATWHARQVGWRAVCFYPMIGAALGVSRH